jgi:hypothetical protein
MRVIRCRRPGLILLARPAYVGHAPFLPVEVRQRAVVPN